MGERDVVIGVAQRPAEGETLCGDAYAIVRRGPRTLVALADGLGHGPEAARAAQAFCGHAETAADRPLETILTSADRAMSGTRGVAAALLRLDPPSHFEFAAVGNVVLRVFSRKPIHPFSVAGTLGRRYSRRPRCDRFAVEQGDLLVMHTDGVSERYELERLTTEAPDRVARELLDTHGRLHDDATCLVIRWDAGPGAGAAGGEGPRELP
jgi:negative regulator of sigma-B (phosphoserine phosphatase)